MDDSERYDRHCGEDHSGDWWCTACSAWVYAEECEHWRRPGPKEKYCSKCGQPETNFDRLEWDPYHAEWRCWTCLHRNDN